MIWLIGNKGMLGTELSLLLEKSGYSFIGTDREVDITTTAALGDFIHTQQDKKQPIDWIINCAAYTAVDKAEDEIEICKKLNTTGAGNIASCAKNINAKLIHISTDYVFNGQGNRPYKEEDATDPIGVYGLTKRDGEIKVFEENKNTYIIRTAWLYGKYGNNFVHTMLRLMKERDKVKIVNDQRGSPTWAFDLAEAVIAFIKAEQAGKDVPYWIYHFTNEGEISWFDFAREIYDQGRAIGILTKNCDVMPCTSAEFPAKVKRPAYSVLDKSKIKATLKINIPTWDISLKEFLKSNDDLKQ
ncbi:dTDP-4-dehydrorhamnose reductase [Treponema sp. R8-4-B8]